MHCRTALLSVVLILGACGGGGSNVTSRSPESPADPGTSLLPGADPHVAYFDGKYWIYRTSTSQETTSALYAYVGESISNDRQDWETVGPLITLSDISWIDDDGAPVHHLWAPAVHERAGRYYLYFSVGPQNPTPSRIGVAVADHPGGPFVDSGDALLTGGSGFEAIDPMVFADPAANLTYLYAGGSAGSTLRVFQLRDSLVEIGQEFPIEQPRSFTEGAFMHMQDGIYYLSYSNGRYNDDTYSAHYSMGASPIGPWTYCGVLAETDSTRKGPGHNSFLQDPSDPATWYFVYHQWDSSFVNPPYSGDRHIVFETLDLGSRGCAP